MDEETVQSLGAPEHIVRIASLTLVTMFAIRFKINSFLLLLVRHLFLVAWHLFLLASCY